VREQRIAGGEVDGAYILGCELEPALDRRERAARRRARFVEPVQSLVAGREQRRRLVVLGPHLDRLGEVCDGLLEPPLAHPGAGAEIVGIEAPRVELRGMREGAMRADVVARHGEHQALGDVGVGELGGDLEGPRRCGACGGDQLAVPADPGVQPVAALDDPEPGGDEARVECDRPFEHLARGVKRLDVHRPQEVTPAQVVVVSLDVLGWNLADFALLALGQDHAQRRGDLGGDLVLQGEDIGELAVEAVRPELIAVLGLDQLDAHAQAVAGPPHAALEDRADAERTTDRAHILAAPLEGERRGA